MGLFMKSIKILNMTLILNNIIIIQCIQYIKKTRDKTENKQQQQKQTGKLKQKRTNKERKNNT